MTAVERIVAGILENALGGRGRQVHQVGAGAASQEAAENRGTTTAAAAAAAAAAGRRPPRASRRHLFENVLDNGLGQRPAEALHDVVVAEQRLGRHFFPRRRRRRRQKRRRRRRGIGGVEAVVVLVAVVEVVAPVVVVVAPARAADTTGGGGVVRASAVVGIGVGWLGVGHDDVGDLLLLVAALAEPGRRRRLQHGRDAVGTRPLTGADAETLRQAQTDAGVEKALVLQLLQVIFVALARLFEDPRAATRPRRRRIRRRRRRRRDDFDAARLVGVFGRRDVGVAAAAGRRLGVGFGVDW